MQTIGVSELSPVVEEQIDGFVVHIRDERKRSVHTVAAYQADVRGLFGLFIRRNRQLILH